MDPLEPARALFEERKFGVCLMLLDAAARASPPMPGTTPRQLQAQTLICNIHLYAERGAWWQVTGLAIATVQRVLTVTLYVRVHPFKGLEGCVTTASTSAKTEWGASGLLGASPALHTHATSLHFQESLRTLELQLPTQRSVLNCWPKRAMHRQVARVWAWRGPGLHPAMADMCTPVQVLGLKESASETVTRRQFRLLAQQVHPDKTRCFGAESAFKLISKAASIVTPRASAGAAGANK